MYPPGIVTRTCTVGGATAQESGDPLILSVVVASSRGLIWAATGWRLPSLPRTVASTVGSEATFELPVTSQAGYRSDGSPGTIIDVSAPGSYSHTYTATVTITTPTGGLVSQHVIGPFPLPAEDLSPVDLDTMLPVGTVAGGAVLVPDSWGAMVAAAEAAAVSVANTLTTEDLAVASFVGNGASATRVSLASAFESRAQARGRASGLYFPTDSAWVCWRAKRGRVLAGGAQGHIAVVGDSLGFGAAATGNTPPKYNTSWPGRLRSRMTSRYGSAGTGIVPAYAQVRANPAWDPRWAFTGNVVDQPWGFHKQTCFRVDNGTGTNHIEFTGTGDTFTVYCIAGGSGLVTALVDGVQVGTFSNALSEANSPTLLKRTGYWATGSVATLVVDIPAGAVGSHTLKLVPPANSAYDLFLIGVEARVTGNGSMRITNASVSGSSLTTLGSLTGGADDDPVNGLWGLGMVDMLKADLLVIALGINNMQGGTTIANMRTMLTTLVNRQRSTGTNAGGGSHAGGDALLVWNPTPDLAAIPAPGPSWAEFRAVFYEMADTLNVPLLDMGERWKDYATGNTLSYFADGIHPSDLGAFDIAGAVETAVLA